MVGEMSPGLPGRERHPVVTTKLASAVTPPLPGGKDLITLERGQSREVTHPSQCCQLPLPLTHPPPPPTPLFLSTFETFSTGKCSRSWGWECAEDRAGCVIRQTNWKGDDPDIDFRTWVPLQPVTCRWPAQQSQHKHCCWLGLPGIVNMLSIQAKLWCPASNQKAIFQKNLLLL